MGVTFMASNIHPYLWINCWHENVTAKLISCENLKGNRNTNKIDLVVHYMQLSIVAMWAAGLSTASFGCDNFTAVS